MKVCVIQPRYSFCEDDAGKCFEELIGLMEKCDESMDLIVLPEYSDVMACIKGKARFYNTIEEYNDRILNKAKEIAKRCSALVFVNAGYKSEGGIRNTTYAINRDGTIAGHYFKAHPAPSEVKTDAEGGKELDVGYSYEQTAPYVLELEGLRIGFLTCYDFYFYENYARLARENLDIIIGCSHQRTDTHEALSIINKFLCYHTNTYLVRSSVSLGEDSEVCGCSVVISPKGEELVNMKSNVGLATCEIDPKEKFYKAAGYGGARKAHYEYIEEGRRPRMYRNAGASVSLFDDILPYPRICAHRGFNTVAPENSLPAFGAAVALGAEEIEFDIWSTKDGKLVSCHDYELGRVSDGDGNVSDSTYEQLLELDFGSKHGEKFKGLKIASFEDILKKFAGRVIMNIHVKIWDCRFEDDKMEEIVSLIRKYDCEKFCYFMTANDEMIRKVRAYAHEIKCCVGWDGNREPLSMVNRAIALGADRIQLFKPYFTQETVDKAHANGIKCNVFWADDLEEAIRYRKMGIDCILTNDYLAIKNALENC